MSRSSWLLLLALAACAAPQQRAVVHSAPPSVIATDSFFHYLSPYGVWTELPTYGRVWQPAEQVVGAKFFPYGTGGHWVFTEAGWVFASDAPFSWAVFHYGRWLLDPVRGWVWVPGDRWAPAWVSWRAGGPYIGWAPLGPEGAPGFDPQQWRFVEAAKFLSPDVRDAALGEPAFQEAVAATRPVYDSVVGPPPADVAAATQQEIKPLPVSRVPGAGRVIPPPPPRSLTVLTPP